MESLLFEMRETLAKRHREAFIEAANARAEQPVSELERESSGSLKRSRLNAALERAPAKRRLR